MRISDEKLYELCRQYGERARMWRQKFAGLLPEVFRRRLYSKNGFGSIFEFAAKLAGMSEEQVRRVLNLEKKFEAMPILKTLLVNGEVSVNKLAKVASVATPENQDFLANQVQLLSCRALETLARDEKSVHVNTNPSQSSQNASAVDAYVTLSLSNGESGAQSPDELSLSPEVRQRLLDLRRKGIDINELILQSLNQREHEIAQQKHEIAEALQKEEELAFEAELHGVSVKKSRHIPAKIKHLIKQEYGTKCAVPLCENPSKQIHHTERFALSKSHNPYFLAPLCVPHHAIAHAIDVKVQESRAGP